MNKIVLINILLWLCLALYLLVANLGFFGVGFTYSSEKYSPWRSHFWPRANHEVLDGGGIIFHKTTWLDLNLPVMFQKVTLEIQGENFENLELAWKAMVEGEVLLLHRMPDNGYLELDLSAISKPRYLVFSIKENQEFVLDKLKISFSQPSWFYAFKKNMLK